MLTNQRVTPSSSEPIRRRINEIHKTGAEREKKKGNNCDWLRKSWENIYPITTCGNVTLRIRSSGGKQVRIITECLFGGVPSHR